MDPSRTASKLLSYCAASDWAGYDPYDALNSRIFAVLPFLDTRLPRLALTQALKRSPLNIRRLALIPRTQNPKALALFLAAALRMPDLPEASRGALIETLTARLRALRSPDMHHWCWGYSFPWQTRTVVVPRWSPNLVCTSFVANALLDAYERQGDRRFLEMARSAGDYIATELFWTDGTSVASFAYPLPSHRIPIHNANLIGAALLCRLCALTGDDEHLERALSVARYSAGQQQDDGAWAYGEHSTLRWIDNFHTGYNLCALRSIAESAKTTDFVSHVDVGFQFYRRHFIRGDGAARYFHDRTYPIDIHSVAQTIITLVTLRDLRRDNVALAWSVFGWAARHMWDERGFFYYRRLRSCTIRTPYIRWSQAWMLLAIVSLLGTRR
jgi:hypothetical protein